MMVTTTRHRQPKRSNRLDGPLPMLIGIAVLAFGAAACGTTGTTGPREGGTVVPPLPQTTAPVQVQESSVARVTAGFSEGQPSDTSLSAQDCAESIDSDQETVADELRGISRWILATAPARLAGIEPTTELFTYLEFDVALDLEVRAAGDWEEVVPVSPINELPRIFAGNRLAPFLANYEGDVLLGLTEAPAFSGQGIDTAYAVVGEGLIRLQSCGARAFATADLLKAAEAEGFAGNEMDLVATLSPTDVDRILGLLPQERASEPALPGVLGDGSRPLTIEVNDLSAGAVGKFLCVQQLERQNCYSLDPGQGSPMLIDVAVDTSAALTLYATDAPDTPPPVLIDIQLPGKGFAEKVVVRLESDGTIAASGDAMGAEVVNRP